MSFQPGAFAAGYGAAGSSSFGGSPAPGFGFLDQDDPSLIWPRPHDSSEAEAAAYGAALATAEAERQQQQQQLMATITQMLQQGAGSAGPFQQSLAESPCPVAPVDATSATMRPWPPGIQPPVQGPGVANGSNAEEQHRLIHRLRHLLQKHGIDEDAEEEQSSGQQAFDSVSLLQERDEEVAMLRQLILRMGEEQRHAMAECQAIQALQQQQLACWERVGRRMLASAERVLGTFGDEVEGRFVRSATKLSLTLTQGKDGDVSDLRRTLKDALKNTASKDGAHAKRPLQQLPEETVAASRNISATTAASSDSKKPSLSLSGASSRDTSPGGSGPEMDGDISPRSSQQMLRERSMIQAVSRMANDVRQLLQMAPAAPPASPVGASAENSPRSKPGSCGAPVYFDGVGGGLASEVGGSLSVGERARLQKSLEGLAPVKKSIAENIMAVERQLRGLDADLRGQCEELLGQQELEAACDENGGAAEPDAEEEARRRLPLSEDSQVSGLVALRQAQQQSTAALSEFVELPQKLKAIFDFTRWLGSEVLGSGASSLGGVSRSAQAAVATSPPLGASSASRGKEDRSVEATQDSVEAVVSGDDIVVVGAAHSVSTDEQLKAAAGGDDVVLTRVADRASTEEQLKAQVRKLVQSLSSKDKCLRSLEAQLHDCYQSRQSERSRLLQPHLLQPHLLPPHLLQPPSLARIGAPLR